MAPKTQISRFKIVEADLEQLRDHYARTLKPVRVLPIVRGGRVSVEDLHFSVGEFDIWSGQCRSGMEVNFTEPPDAFAIYLPIRGAMEMVSGGRSLVSTSRSIIAADLAQSKTLKLHQNRSHIGIAFSRAAVRQQLSELLDGPAVHDLDLTSEVPMGVAAHDRLSDLGQFLWRSLESDGSEMLSMRSTEYLFKTIMISLLENVPHRYSGMLERPIAAAVPRQVKRAIDYMTANLGQPLDIADIAREAGVSVRSLQVAFQQFKDMSPLEFLRLLRLRAVRDDIMSGAVGTVSDIARRWGFSHMGRFSALYRQAFGEFPLQSLQRGRAPR
jgi:AraC-like DNA-binding protein